MATEACTDFAAKFHNDGWDTYGKWVSNKSRTSYVASTSILNDSSDVTMHKKGQFITVIRIKTPEIDDLHHDAKLKVKIPFFRYSFSDTSGYIYFKVFEEDPTDIDPTNSSGALWFTEKSDGVEKCSWSTSDVGAHLASFDSFSIVFRLKKLNILKLYCYL